MGHPVAGQAEGPPAAGLGRDLHRHLATEGGHLHLGAEDRLPDGNRQLDVQVVLAALEHGMRHNLDTEIEVSAGATAGPGGALPGHPNTRAISDAGGDLHLHPIGAGHPAGATAGGTRRLALPARPAAGSARLELLELHRPPGPAVGLVEADLDLGLEIAAPATTPRGPERSLVLE